MKTLKSLVFAFAAFVGVSAFAQAPHQNTTSYRPQAQVIVVTPQAHPHNRHQVRKHIHRKHHAKRHGYYNATGYRHHAPRHAYQHQRPHRPHHDFRR